MGEQQGGLHSMMGRGLTRTLSILDSLPIPKFQGQQKTGGAEPCDVTGGLRVLKGRLGFTTELRIVLEPVKTVVELSKICLGSPPASIIPSRIPGLDPSARTQRWVGQEGITVALLV